MRKLLLCLTLLPACGIIGPDIDFTKHEPLGPVPELYREWYADVELCLGIAGEFNAVIWYIADDIIYNGVSSFGLWQEAHRITMKATHLHSIRNVRHEMIHHILQRGNSAHGLPEFDCINSRSTYRVSPL